MCTLLSIILIKTPKNGIILIETPKNGIYHL